MLSNLFFMLSNNNLPRVQNDNREKVSEPEKWSSWDYCSDKTQTLASVFPIELWNDEDSHRRMHAWRSRQCLQNPSTPRKIPEHQNRSPPLLWRFSGRAKPEWFEKPSRTRALPSHEFLLEILFWFGGCSLSHNLHWWQPRSFQLSMGTVSQFSFSPSTYMISAFALSSYSKGT